MAAAAGASHEQQLVAKLLPMGFSVGQISAACASLGGSASEAAVIGLLLGEDAGGSPASPSITKPPDGGDAEARLRAMGFTQAQIAGSKDAVGSSLPARTEYLLGAGSAPPARNCREEMVGKMKNQLHDFNEVQVDNALDAIEAAGAPLSEDAVRAWIEDNLVASQRPSVDLICRKLLEMGLDHAEAVSKADAARRSTSTLQAAINFALHTSVEEEGGGAAHRTDVITGEVLPVRDMFICECDRQHMFSFQTFFIKIVQDLRGGSVPVCPLSAAADGCQYSLTQKETEDVISAVLRHERLRHTLVDDATTALLELAPDEMLVNGQRGWKSHLVSRIYMDKVKADAGFIECPRQGCGWFVERVGPGGEGAGGIEAADLPPAPNGQPLTEGAARHMLQNRFRCKACSTNFCSSCKAVPYHIGSTCEEHRAHQDAKRCRFCDAALTRANTSTDGDGGVAGCVCTGGECQEKKKLSCGKVLVCGHPCCGVRGESECLPCLEEDCRACGTNTDEYCNICYTEGLGAAPTIRLQCNHFFHYACLRRRLETKWASARIVFNFLFCPLCNRDIEHPALDDLLEPHRLLRVDVRRKAEQRLHVEGLDKDAALAEPGSRYFQKPAEYALDTLTYYQCFKCKQSYYGGRAQCDLGGAAGGGGEQEEDFDPAELVCGGCAQKGATCAAHGAEYIQWKCKFCCTPAVWFCGGHTHFCDPCHRIPGQRWAQEKNQDASGLPACPGADLCAAGGVHPPLFSEHCLGCSMCKADAFF